MEGVAKPLLADFVSRRYARGGPPATWLVCQPLGGVIAYVSYLTHIRPSVLTGASLVLGVSGCATLAAADASASFLLAGVLLVLSYVFDCADGQLARATGDATYRGAWLDIVADATIVVGLALAVLTQSPDDDWIALAFVASMLLGAGRAASLITTALSRRDPERTAWTSQGLTRVARVTYVSVIDTPVAYVLLVAAAAAGPALMLVAAVLGTASFGHALVIGTRIYPADSRHARGEPAVIPRVP